MRASDYIPEPTIFLLGCQPWPPKKWNGDRCPVCGAGIKEADHHVYCGWSDETSPAREAQIRKARRAADDQARAEADRRRAERKLNGKRWPVLSEAERRMIWNGYRHTVLSEVVGDQVTNLARAGRDWLTAIGQVPDWDLALDGKGRVIDEFTD